VNRIELVSEDEPGFWEGAGYHDVSDPWNEQRFR
jgi:DMSO/TMAO reductase YedYZ molybdopterin-dependent catalytic subunit